jgi:hypothetical protein
MVISVELAAAALNTKEVIKNNIKIKINKFVFIFGTVKNLLD